MPHSPIQPIQPILVVGATGTVGREVVRALLERGAPVRALVRSHERAAHLPAQVQRVLGTLADPPSITAALQGTQAAFYISPHDRAEEAYASAFLAACETARVRLVFAGVHIDGRGRLHRALLRALYGLMMPHYRPKMRLAERIRQSPLRPVVLIPGNYFQNETLFLGDMATGTYPLPLAGVGRVDTRDIGDAAARALLDPHIPGGAYALTTPGSLSGADAAAEWSAALGRPVSYEPDLKRAAEVFGREVGGQKAVDFTRSYALLARFRAAVSPAAAAQTTFLLGRPARTHAAYVRDMVAAHPAVRTGPHAAD